MHLSSPVARVSFVIHLDSRGCRAEDVARIRQMARLFHRRRFLTTWSAPGCYSLELLQHNGILQAGDDFALDVSHFAPSNSLTAHEFRDEFHKRLSAIHSSAAQQVRQIVGQPIALRRYGAILAEQGIRGVIVKSDQVATHADRPLPLPCGLWQVNVGIEIPPRGWLPGIFSGTGRAIKRLADRHRRDTVLLVGIRAEPFVRSHARGMEQLNRLLQKISLAASQQEIRVVRSTEIVQEMVAQRSPRPQQSILRAA